MIIINNYLLRCINIDKEFNYAVITRVTFSKVPPFGFLFDLCMCLCVCRGGGLFCYQYYIHCIKLYAFSTKQTSRMIGPSIWKGKMQNLSGGPKSRDCRYRRWGSLLSSLYNVLLDLQITVLIIFQFYLHHKNSKCFNSEYVPKDFPKRKLPTTGNANFPVAPGISSNGFTPGDSVENAAVVCVE